MFFSLIYVFIAFIIKTQCPTHNSIPHSFLDIDTPYNHLGDNSCQNLWYRGPV